MIATDQTTDVGNRTLVTVVIGFRIIHAERLPVDVTYKVNQYDRFVDSNRKVIFHNIQHTMFNEAINYSRDIFASALLKSGIADGCQFVVGRKIFHVFGWLKNPSERPPDT